ncbi:MAG: hypothetical protein WC566_10450 [Dehalococcoidia bacterium]
MRSAGSKIKLIFHLAKQAWLFTLVLYASIGLIVLTFVAFFPSEFDATIARWSVLNAQNAIISFFVVLVIVVIVGISREVGNKPETCDERKLDVLPITPKKKDIPETVQWILLLLIGVVSPISALAYGFINGKLSTAEAMQLFASIILVMVTLMYVFITWQMSDNSGKSVAIMSEQTKIANYMADETKRQRLDSYRPMLIPIKGAGGLAFASRNAVYMEPGELLQIRNIGIGPALNISVRIEERSISDMTECIYTEEQFSVEAVEISGISPIRLFTDDKRVGAIADAMWIVIAYDDIYSRRFQTEGKYVKVNNTWTNIKISDIKGISDQ